MSTTLLPDAPLSIDPTSLEAWEDDLDDMFNTVFRARPHLSMSEWADTNRYLARGTGHESGRWRTSRVPYLREIMDAVSDPDITEMVIMKSARIGYTEGIVGNAIGANPEAAGVFVECLDDQRPFDKHVEAAAIEVIQAQRPLLVSD